MIKEPSQIKDIIHRLSLSFVLASMPVVELILLVFELPLYLKVIFWIYLMIMFALLECICDALFPETEHTEEERKTKGNIEELQIK